jgi:hypothetical protein
MTDLFDSEEKSNKEMEALKRQMADLTSKVEAASKEKEDAQMTWQQEKARLEKTLQEQTPWVQAAQGFNRLAEENPDEAIQRILAAKKKREDASKAKSGTGASINTDEILKPVMEKLTNLEKRQAEDEQQRQIEKFQEAIYESVEYLKSQGVLTDNQTPYEIMNFMKTRGLTDSSHVDLAAKSLYSNALIEAQVKAKRKGNNADAVVLGTNGFEGGDEESENTEETEQAQAPRAKKYKEEGAYFRDDKLWKTLEKSL